MVTGVARRPGGRRRSRSIPTATRSGRGPAATRSWSAAPTRPSTTGTASA